MIEALVSPASRTVAHPLESLDTPALLLDADKLERNCRAMRERMDKHHVTLRPHVKTGKSVEVAQCALGAGAGPITVSTVREAEYFYDHGFRDILYAVGMVPQKVARLAVLVRRGARVTAIVDSVEAAQGLVAAARAQDVAVSALIEIDSDGHRAGVRPDEPRLLEVARALGESLRGVMTHAGESYNCRSRGAIIAMAEQERAAAVRAAQVLRAAGHDCPIVSVGSTPTATFATTFEGVTEVRVGVYVFQDLVMAGLGVCSVDQLALSVLASVIGHQREKNWLITDAGWMAMSRDRGTSSQPVDQGYGVVCDVSGAPAGELIVAEANQEHGIVARRDGGPIDFARYPIGSRLRILPNHACATAAQFGEYHVLRDGRPSEVWERFAGW
jgi:D-serine deaminase-like pyridoxal phosphate-dependent protein